MAGLATTLGSGAMTNSIGEIEFNEVLFVIGSNATEAHPIIGNKMVRAKTRHGAKLVVVDPRRTQLAHMADVWLQLIPGTDAALINGLIHIIIKEGWVDREYVDARCEGFAEVKESVAGYTPAVVAGITGVPEALLYAAARTYTSTKKAGIFYTLGITEHTTGTANVMNLANLALITGHIGHACAGVNPLRGQNNVQGACDMGALPNTLPDYQGYTKESVAKFSRAWGAALPDTPGLTIPEMFDAARAGRLKSMYVMGEDPVLTDPDANHVRKSLAGLDFLVVQDLFMTETAAYADVFLPAALYAEKDGTFTNTERRVQRVRKAVDPPGRSRPDWEIISDLAQRMGYPMAYASAADIFAEIRSLMPSHAGITYARIEENGLQWPCPTPEHPGTQFLHKDRFVRGKARMVPVAYEAPAELPDAEYPMLLTTGRMLYHHNIGSRLSENLDRLVPHERAQINPQDAARLGIAADDRVRVTSRRGSIVTHVEITDQVRPGLMFMTLHYKESPVNELTNAAFDPVTKTAEYKVSAVKVERI